MPKKRLPAETWKNNIRPIVWNKDKKKCVRCKSPVTLTKCHIDHIQSGLKGTNKINNLRTLCRKCHVLRKDFRHRRLIHKALKDGLIPPNWREHLW
jgi:5-methylcytosine-specific restriction endonuclease McrA